MVPSYTLLSLLIIGITSATANPVSRSTGKATLDFVTRINERGVNRIIDNDRARAQAMKTSGRLGRRSTSFDISNANVHYNAQVGVGSPPTEYTLLIDTGSSNTWVGANKAYIKTSTSRNTGNTVSVSYGSGKFSGEEWTDTVTLAPGLVINNQSIGVASSSTGLGGLDGILGVGPTNLTSGTVGNMSTVPTVSDNLHSQGTISQEVLGVYFIPAAEASKTGELTFGGYNDQVTIEPVYAPLTMTHPASLYWGFNQSISYGFTPLLNSTAGILDTGTTLTLIATDAFRTYQGLTGGTKDSATGLLKITAEQYARLEPLKFIVEGVPFILTPNAQIWPRSLNTAIGGTKDGIYLIIADIGTPSGSGLDFINGYTFLERYYSVYDTTNHRVGLAPTEFTLSDIN